MKKSEILVGHTYVNRGAGLTRRKVLAIGDEFRPKVFYSAHNEAPDEPGVEYIQTGHGPMRQGRLYLSSFAQWAGRDVTVEAKP